MSIFIQVYYVDVIAYQIYKIDDAFTWDSNCKPFMF